MIDFEEKGIKVQKWVVTVLALLTCFFLSKIYFDNETWKVEHAKEEKEYRSQQTQDNKDILRVLNEIKESTAVQKQFNDYMKSDLIKLEKRVEKLEEQQ